MPPMPRRRPKTLPALLLALLLVLAASASMAAAAPLPGAKIAANKFIQPATYPGLQHRHFEYGPINISPGQNTIEFRPNNQRPSVPGYVTRFAPNLVYASNHKVPRVDVIHLHHGVWLSNLQPLFAAGEEKTIVQLPRGYGLPYQPADQWLLNYMIHNVTATPTQVYMTYDIDFLPAPAALTPVHARWMDVSGFRLYPGFDVHKGSGSHGRFTFPDQARGAQRRAIGPA